MIRTSLLACLCLFAMLASNSVHGITFSVPDAGLPVDPGTGLRGTLWSNAEIEPIDTLASARSYIGANPLDAEFLASKIDYPQGPEGSTSTDTLLKEALGTDSPSLTPIAVGDRITLNSIFRFTGYLRVDQPGVWDLNLGSDDGSELVIQGVSVINNDDLHSFPGNAGPVPVQFDTPGLYALDVLFFESQPSSWGLELYDGQGTIPTEKLYVAVPEPQAWCSAAVWGVALLQRRVRWFDRKS